MRLFKPALVVCLLVGFLFFLAGCSLPDGGSFASSKPTNDVVVVVDATTPSITEAVVQRLLRRVTGPAISAGKSVALWTLSGHAGARRLALFVPSKPVSEAKKVLALHQAEQLRDAEQLFSAVMPVIFGDVPKTSPLAAAILTATAGRTGPVDLYVLSDMRETAVSNVERGILPDAEQWTTRLERIGFTKDSLNGVRVHIVGMPLIASADQDASPARGLAIQDLWRSLTAFGASSITFEDDHSGALFLVLPFAAGFALRKFKAGRMGKADAKHGVPFHAPRAVESLIGPKPLPEFDDTEIAEAQETIERERRIIDACKVKIRELRSTIARQPSYWLRIIGITALLDMDGVATATMLHDLGTPSPHDVIFGIGTAGLLIGLAALAGKATKIDGKKPLWWWVTVGTAALIVLSLTLVRVSNAPATGDPLIVVIAIAIVQGMGVLGPPLLSEMLFEQLRPVMPNVKELRDQKRQLKDATTAYTKAFKFLSLKAQLRQAWDHESTILSALYTRAFLAAGGRLPPPPTAHFASQPSPSTPPVPSTNGLPQWPS